MYFPSASLSFFLSESSFFQLHSEKSSDNFGALFMEQSKKFYTKLTNCLINGLWFESKQNLLFSKSFGWHYSENRYFPCHCFNSLRRFSKSLL